MKDPRAKPSLLCSNRQQTVEARFFASTCTTVVAFCLRTNGSEQQNRFQRRASNEPLRSDCKVVRAGEAGLEKAFAAHRPPNSRGNIVERVLSLDAHVHYQTKPSLLCSNRQQTVEARFFASTCTTVVAFCLRTNGSEQQNRFQRRAQTNHSPRAFPTFGVRCDLEQAVDHCLVVPRTGGLWRLLES